MIRPARTAIHRLAAGAVLAAVIPVLPATATASASAATPSLQGDAAVRPCVTTSDAACRPGATLSRRTVVTMECWIDGSWATGAYSTNRWFRITAGLTRGFVHASWVVDQTRVGHCGTDRPVATTRGAAAARWAEEHLGWTRPSQDEAAGLGINDGMWSGWCAAFAYGAYRYGAGATPRMADNAAPRYRAYSDAGLTRPWAGPDIPVGSMVFWPNVAAPYGHTAIYVGGGQVISTLGLNDPRRPISSVPVGTWGSPVGWVAPQDV